MCVGGGGGGGRRKGEVRGGGLRKALVKDTVITVIVCVCVPVLTGRR